MMIWAGQISRGLLGVVASALLLAICNAPAAAGTLDEVRARGHVLCGVADGPLGFSHIDEQGVWSGLDVDFCAALAAAIFGDKSAVKYRPLMLAERFSALRAGDVDLLGRSATWTLSRDMDLGVRFVDTLFHDGQAVMVKRAQAVTSVLELSGATICVLAQTPAARHVSEYFAKREMQLTVLSFEKWDAAVEAYLNGRCTALSADLSTLALVRATIDGAGAHQFLPEMLSKEPLGPVVRQGDPQWFGIVRWVLYALIAAEELGVTSSNAAESRQSKVVEVRRLLGTEGDLGASLGLGRDWAYQAIRQVGNYGEVFERNVGMRSPLKLERRANGLWFNGGLMQAPPVR
jgi:general L-amino acid transport system substrate-binding protein